jgi:hypothetical protein
LRNLQTSSSAAETQANLCNSEQLQARRMKMSPLFFVIKEVMTEEVRNAGHEVTNKNHKA